MIAFNTFLACANVRSVSHT